MLRSADLPKVYGHILKGLDFVVCYLDDILITLPDEKTHLSDLHQVFKRVNKYGLYINAAKSTLGFHSIEFLGYKISSEGIQPLPSKIGNVVH